MSAWSDLAKAMAEPWPDLQNDDGRFPDDVQGGQPGVSARYGRDGSVTVTGGFLGGDGNWHRRGVSFAIAPVADGGVRLRFNATAGGRFECSVFFVDGEAAPQPDATSVFDWTLRATSAAPYDVAFEDGYASDAEPKLVRARLALRAAADGPLDVTVGPA
jgi:hypothetical protein